FSNYQGVPGGIANVVADAFFGQYMKAPDRRTVAANAASGVDVPAATLQSYAGKYEMTTLGGLLLNVELQGGQLRLKLPGQPAAPLRPPSMTVFDTAGAPAQITFNAADGGSIEGITFQQDGAQHPGKRV